MIEEVSAASVPFGASVKRSPRRSGDLQTLRSSMATIGHSSELRDLARETQAQDSSRAVIATSQMPYGSREPLDRRAYVLASRTVYDNHGQVDSFNLNDHETGHVLKFAPACSFYNLLIR